MEAIMTSDKPRWMLTANCAATLRDEEPAALANAFTYDQLLLSIGEAVIDKLNFIVKIPEYRDEIREIAKKAINKTYPVDTFTPVILGDLHLAQKNLQDAYENKATIGGKQISMNPQFIVKRLDEVTEAITSILAKVDDIKSIRDCCSNIKAQLPGKEEGFGFDLKIGTETATVKVEVYEEQILVDGDHCCETRITYILKDYPSLRGDIRVVAPDDMKKEGGSFIDLDQRRVTERPLFKKLYMLKNILDHERLAFRWQPDDTKDEDVK